MSIFGWEHKKVQNFGPAKREKCNNCSNETTFQLQKLSTYFTIFDCPIFPYKINYRLVCPLCKNHMEIEGTEFYEFIDRIQSDKETDSRMISPEGYVTENGAIYRTETQLNFIRQMKEIEMEREKRNNGKD